MENISEEWSILQAEVDGYLLIATVSLSAKRSEVTFTHPWCFSVSTSIRSQGLKEGLPAFPETDELNLWEDKITNEIRAASCAVFFGRITWNGTRELIYYVDNPEPISEVLRKLNRQNLVREFEYQWTFDPEWDNIQIYIGEE